MTILYHAEPTLYSLKPLIILEELGVDYERRQIAAEPVVGLVEMVPIGDRGGDGIDRERQGDRAGEQDAERARRASGRVFRIGQKPGPVAQATKDLEHGGDGRGAMDGPRRYGGPPAKSIILMGTGMRSAPPPPDLRTLSAAKTSKPGALRAYRVHLMARNCGQTPATQRRTSPSTSVSSALR